MSEPMSGFRAVGDSASLPDRYVNAYYIPELKRRIAVARVGDKLYAFDDLVDGCPLSSGLLSGTTLMSQCDGSLFQLSDGAVLRGPASEPLRMYAVRETGGAIEVRP